MRVMSGCMSDMMSLSVWRHPSGWCKGDQMRKMREQVEALMEMGQGGQERLGGSMGKGTGH